MDTGGNLMTKARDLANAADVLDDVSATELSYVNGVTSAIQTQIDGKQAVVSGVNDTEIGYLDGVTSAIQTQIDSKIGSASAISPTLIDAKGDLIVGSADNTAARLAVGTNNHVLTADSAATNGVKWAAVSSGALTLISATSFSASSAHSVNDVFSATYDNYLIQISTTAMSTNLYCAMRLRVSGSDNSSNEYGWSKMANGSGNNAYDGNYSNGLISSWYLLNGDGANHINGYIEVTLRSPYLTARTGFNDRVSANSGTGSYQHHGGGMMSVNTSYTGFTLIATTGNMTGNVKVYGYANS